MKTVEAIRSEIAAIASELHAQDASSAAQLDALNHTFYTTTTEYLVETMSLLQNLKGRPGLRASGLDERLRAVERSARELANLR